MKGYNARYVRMISAVAALGGLLFGYDFVVIGGAKPFYERCFQLNGGHLVGWANSCALLGCLLGSMAAGGLSERLGRKKLLILSAFLFAISSVLTGWAPLFTWFVVWRIVGGVVFDADLKSFLHLSIGRPIVARGRQRPGIGIQREGVHAPGEFAPGDRERFLRLMGVIHVVSSQLVIGVVGEVDQRLRLIVFFLGSHLSIARVFDEIHAVHHVREATHQVEVGNHRVDLVFRERRGAHVAV
jgi:hypothetical protein